MFIIRPIEKKDQDIFIEFSCSSTLGFRNLPRDKEKLEQKIHISEQSFKSQIIKPEHEEYYFVLEDLKTGHIGGICGILASLNPKHTFTYRVETNYHSVKNPSIVEEIKILKLKKFFKSASEVCSLYLEPSFRHSGLGRLLSLSRFLFIADQRKRFHKKIVAELRGYIDDSLHSPFWDAVGRHFCNLSFVDLMSQLEHDTLDIAEILPRYPIYVSLLPKVAQEAIGKTHEATKPALNMLLHEGFAFMNEIDALEGGPSVTAAASKIRSIKESRLIKIEIATTPMDLENEYILSNNDIHFRACYGKVKLSNKKGYGVISEEVAAALRVKKGDVIRYVAAH